MSTMKHLGCGVGLASLALTSAGFGEDETAALKSRLAAAEARLAQLEAANDKSWLTEQRAAEIRGLVHDVLADADTRASLQGNGATAGYDDGFFISSSDGNFSLRLNGQLQVRFAYNHQDDNSDDSHRWGFENSRTKLVFSGHVVNPQWQYRIEGNFNGDPGDSGTFRLEDAWIGHDFQNGWFVLVGQYKCPLIREELVDSSKQLAVERSNVADVLTSGRRFQGIAASYTADNWSIKGSYSDGDGFENTTALAEDTEYAFTARGELKLQGTWDQFNDFTSFPDGETGVLIGLGAHTQRAEFGTALMADQTTVYAISPDVSIEGGGWNAFASLIYANLDTDGGEDRDLWGFVIQGGLFITDNCELFARYEHADLDLADTDDLSIATVGLNKYISGHQVKWTTDVGYAFDSVPAVGEFSNWRVDGGEDDGQIVVRSQMQLLF